MSLRDGFRWLNPIFIHILPTVNPNSSHVATGPMINVRCILFIIVPTVYEMEIYIYMVQDGQYQQQLRHMIANDPMSIDYKMLLCLLKQFHTFIYILY